MHIGVDLDNTLVDATTAHLVVYKRVSGQTKTTADVDDFHLWRLYGWTAEQAWAVYTHHGHEIHAQSDPMPGAVTVMQAWYEQHQISIITARPAFHDVTRAWLARHQVPYHALVFTQDKYAHCASHAVDVLIEDGPHYAEEFARHHRSIVLLDHPYNRGLTGGSIYRARDWREVAHHVEALGSHAPR